jgi:DNA polymerase
VPRTSRNEAGGTACDLYKRGTQTVFGEGARRAAAMFVGEQPGNEEDLAGRRSGAESSSPPRWRRG